MMQVAQVVNTHTGISFNFKEGTLDTGCNMHRQI